MVSVVARSELASGRQHRFPVVESVMDGARTQPHIHNTTVTLVIANTAVQFRIFYKRHLKLPLNHCVSHILPPNHQPIVHGDLLVMKLASDGDLVVNMQAGDVGLADLAVSL
jgi:hypothetical protein